MKKTSTQTPNSHQTESPNQSEKVTRCTLNVLEEPQTDAYKWSGTVARENPDTHTERDRERRADGNRDKETRADW